MKIVIDEGHGATDNLYIDGKTYEGYQMYFLGYYLYNELKSKNRYTLKSTRNKVTDNPTLLERGSMAEGADLFISLHSNACTDASVTRVVVIPTITNQTAKFRNFCQAIGDAVKVEMGVDQKTQIYERSYKDVNDGLTKDYYGVIRSAVQAGCKNALILEHSFHTNEESAKWLADYNNLKGLALVEANLIDKFLYQPKIEDDYWGHYPTDYVTYSVLKEILEKEKDSN